MKWFIPAKTFLLGEYAALAKGSALLLTTVPYFELCLIEKNTLINIHLESPAGLWWKQHPSFKQGLHWKDPYQGIGGLGASSAQFLGAYWASCYLENKQPTKDNLLKAYYQCAWSGQGLRPSGYDVLAQSQKGLVYINEQRGALEGGSWPFSDLAFILIHTGKKLATHQHLQETPLPSQLEHLSALVDEAKEAIEQQHSELLIYYIQQYHKALAALHLVAPYTLNLLQEFQKDSEILAAKGCGALGADVLLLLCEKKKLQSCINKLNKTYSILATSENLTSII